jgi:lipoprotein-releasing system ATP-binding protein
MNDQTEPAIVAKAVNKSYVSGDTHLHVLNTVDFSLPKGESAVILGKSGSGKSTFLHLLGGLDTVDSGSLQVAGRQLELLKERGLERFRRTCIGFIFQSHYLLDDFTLLENVYLPAVMSGFPRKESIESAKQLISQVGLYDRKDHFPRRISGGERQRTAVARALINEPELILADEPTGNLDEYNSRIVEDLLFSLVETYARSMVLVTHDISMRFRGTQSYELYLGKLEPYV